MKLFHVSRDTYVLSGVVSTAIICAESHEAAVRHWPKVDRQMQLEVVELAAASEGQLPGIVMTTQFWGNGTPGKLSTRHPEAKIFIVEVERKTTSNLKVTDWKDHKGPHPDFVPGDIDPATLGPAF